ncbi:MAG: class I SAM-dependent methyltransferase [Candidatus Eisenbacteria bacterium]|uniref:Class I SAM-dependent methyltransferase n=1 Tax=Eiseniibacteriota bacterium TaxID=2212470 RepID=A0A956M0T7_UNCEI|nr:class I SAM-dependent methyltransferase [Candidatus Eisenbacteria bacterium]
MPLLEQVPDWDAIEPASEEVTVFLERAQAFVSGFLEIHESPTTGRVPGYVATNLPFAYRALRWVRVQAPERRRFCEWGSGLGTVTCLASLLGFDARGIEIAPSLVSAARRFASDHRREVQFFEGSFLPEGLLHGESDLAPLERTLGFSPVAFDVVYAYPWPAERPLVLSLFERCADPGTLLVTYLGGADIRIHRKE